LLQDFNHFQVFLIVDALRDQRRLNKKCHCESICGNREHSGCCRLGEFLRKFFPAETRRVYFGVLLATTLAFTAIRAGIELLGDFLICNLR